MAEFLSIRDYFNNVKFLTNEEREVYNLTVINNHGLLMSYGAKLDPCLKSKNDKRYTLSIFGYYEENFPVGGSYKVEKLIQKEFPNHIYYTADKKKAEKSAMLHWTVMQIIGFTQGLKVDEKRIGKYASICEEALYELKGPVTVEYFGLVATPVNILWVAKSKSPVNKVRQKIRDEILHNNLELKEPYKVNIIHSCVVRYFNEINIGHVLQFCEDNRISLKAKHTFSKLYLDYGSALMRPSEIRKVAEFDLIKKKTKWI